MDLMDEPKDGFNPIKTYPLLKESHKEAVVWWYELELLPKQLLDHSKWKKELN